MGLAIRDIIEKEEVSFDELKGKILAVDSYNMLYQFITTIRSRDGTPLMDSKGRVTSHLIGLFGRLSNFMQKGLRLAFVFDGDVPDLKKKELERRKKVKEQAAKEYESAKDKEDVEGMRKYAGRTSRLTKDMVNEAKELISAFGMPVIQAPSEGEAQAAHMAKKKDVYAVVSQDFDSLMQGAPRLVRNLSISGRRKKAGKLSYETIRPEMIILKKNLEKNDLTKDQLIALGLLVGTDYNIGGIKGIGPKKALALVRNYEESSFDMMFKEAGWDETFDTGWKKIFDFIKNTPITDEYELKWKRIDEERIRNMLVREHDFSEERIRATLERLESAKKEQAQKGLGDFF